MSLCELEDKIKSEISIQTCLTPFSIFWIEDRRKNFIIKHNLSIDDIKLIPFEALTLNSNEISVRNVVYSKLSENITVVHKNIVGIFKALLNNVHLLLDVTDKEVLNIITTVKMYILKLPDLTEYKETMYLINSKIHDLNFRRQNFNPIEYINEHFMSQKSNNKDLLVCNEIYDLKVTRINPDIECFLERNEQVYDSQRYAIIKHNELMRNAPMAFMAVREHGHPFWNNFF